MYSPARRSCVPQRRGPEELTAGMLTAFGAGGGQPEPHQEACCRNQEEKWNLGLHASWLSLQGTGPGKPRSPHLLGPGKEVSVAGA